MNELFYLSYIIITCCLILLYKLKQPICLDLVTPEKKVTALDPHATHL